MTEDQFDVIVIGEGISGLTAAGVAANEGLSTASIEGEMFGGLVININELDPAPDVRAISGADFASELAMANQERGVQSINDNVTALRRVATGFEIMAADSTYRARHAIVASGAKHKLLGVPGESEFNGRGVSRCADCDGPLFRGSTVVVVGGGDSAMQEAAILARFCDRVYVVHRGATFRARQQAVEQVSANPKIEILLETVVDRIEGANGVERVHVRAASGGSSRSIDCAGVFPFVGLVPNVSFLPAEMSRDAAGSVMTSDSFETAIPGLWAVGAVRHGYGGTLDHATAEARSAAAAVVARLRQRAS